MVDPASIDDKKDGIHLIRPIVDALKKTFIANAIPGGNVAVDEAMLGMHQRMTLTTIVKSKPEDTGMKLWCLADSENGYIYLSLILVEKVIMTL